jgi:hypothetical protein
MIKLRLSVIALVLLSLGCTRETSNKVQVAISLPGVTSGNGALNNQMLKHIVVNVTGSGMDPFVFNWDVHDNFSSSADLNFEFDQGSGRLVQVLGVYEDLDQNNMMVFFYGDTVADFRSSQLDIIIPIMELSSGYNASGSIQGRYLTSDTSGPTGLVKVTYEPPGKPAMVINYSYIYNGWFHLFALSEVDFTYIMPNGEKLFGGPIRFANSARMPDNNSQIFKMQVPLAQETSGYDREPKFKSFGWFFGPAVSAATRAGKKVCKDSTPAALSEFSDFLTGTTPITFNQEATLSPTSSLFDISDTGSLAYLGAAEFTGGTTSGCISGTGSAAEYETQMTVSDTQLDQFNDGGDLVVGPLRLWDRSTASALSQTAPGIVTGRLLPGVDQVINELRYIVLTEQAVELAIEGDSKILRCDKLPAGLIYASTAVGISDFSLDISSLSSAISANIQGGIGFCFYKSGVALPHGFGSKNDPPYLRVELSGGASYNGVSQKYEVAMGTCYPVTFRTYWGQGNNFENPSAFNITGFSGANYEFFTDPTCSSNSIAGGTWAFPAGTNQLTGVYVKFTSILTDSEFENIFIDSEYIVFRSEHNRVDVIP